ncbi:Chitotriosidase-1 [Armadillidium vulgare]|nr:Chitotriosidase-1 [Armadillidium vulgare]
MMGYDYHGKWDQETGHNAPLYARIDESPNFSVHYYLSQGAPPEKFVLGLGLYGRTFLLTNSSNPGIGAPARKSAFAGPYTREDGFLGYNEICEKLLTEKWSLAWQAAHQAPYMFKDNMWVSFDDVNSLGLKVAFAQRLGLAGVMVWSMDTDDFSGQCGNRYPLLNSINRNLALHAKSRFQERVSTTRPTMKPTMRPTTQTSKQSTPWPSALPSSPSSFWPSISTTFYSSSPSSPTDYYELDKDKPDRVDIDFDTDYNNNLEDTSFFS